MRASFLTHPDVLGVIVGVIGILLAVIFYLRSKEKARPTFSTLQSVLIGTSHRNLPEQVEIRYGGQVIPTLYKYRVAFWNAGRGTLDNADVVPSDPVTFHFNGEDVELLEIRSIKTTRDVTGCSLVQYEADIILSFDFLDRNDGVSFEAFYTGTGAKVTCSGTVKGIQEGFHQKTYSRVPYSWLLPFLPPVFAGVILGLGYVVFSVYLAVTSFHVKHGHSTIDHTRLLSAIFATVIGLWFAGQTLYAYWQRRMPNSLRPTD